MKRSIRISVGARSSPLSRKQVEEVAQALDHLIFDPIFADTIGDRDKTTSLRDLNKCDFFTRDIDQMQLEGKCRIAIHSAKDLPERLAPGLKIAAITRGVDPSDSLVLHANAALQPGMTIATSSKQREERVAHLCDGLTFIDIRGTIEERLAILDQGEIDGVVIAEAALIRLGHTHRHRITLPGKTTPLQGQLAIIVQEDDHEMCEIFQPLDVR